MNKFFAVLRDTLLDITSGKIIFLYGALTLITFMILSLAPQFQIQGQDVISQGMIPQKMMSTAAGYFYKSYIEFFVLLMLFGTAWQIPGYLRKGRVELALSKPIPRPALALMKYISVYVVMCGILLAGTIPIWIILSLRLDSFSMGFFGGLLFGMLDFLILYGLFFSIGLLTRSGAVSIIVYFGFKVVAGLLGQREVIYPYIGDTVWRTVLDVFYHILPKYSQFSDNYLTILVSWEISNFYAIWTTILFTAALFIIALYVFRRRDF